MTGLASGNHSKRFLFCAVLVLATGAGLLAWRVTPWYDAAPVPVQLWLDAPSDTPMTLFWDRDSSGGVPIVPHVSAEETSARLWLAELPPRPDYRLSIVFAAPVRQAVFKELLLIDVRRLDEPVLRVSADEAARKFVADNVQVASTAEGVRIDCLSRGSLSYPEAVSCRRRAPGERFAGAWLMLSAVGLLAGLFVAACIRQAQAAWRLADLRHPGRIARRTLMPIWGAFGLGLAFQLSVASSLPALFNPFDPLMYFHKAVVLAEAGSYSTHTPFWELDRLPGYPLFLAACIKLFGYHLKAITISQGCLFGTGLLALALSLRRWTSPWYTAAAMLVVLASPVGLLHTLTIGTEGLFVALAAFAMAAFFEHAGTQGRVAALWLTVFCLVLTAAVFVRPNGVVLLAAPVTTYLPAVFQAARIQAGWAAKWKVVASCTLRYSLPAVLVVAGLASWAVRNYRAEGLVAPTAMVGVSLVEGQTQSGTFDARALLQERLYRQYLQGKFKANYSYCGWNIRGLLDKQLTQDGKEVADFISVLDRRMNGIAKRSEALSPWELKLAGVLRSAWWGLELPSHDSYTRNQIRGRTWYGGNHPGAIRAWKDFCTSRAMARLGKEISLADLEDQELTTQWPLAFMQSEAWGECHRAAYNVFLIAGLIWGVLILWYNAPVLSAPTLVFLANIGLNAGLLNVQGRYILTLEFLLVFQTMMGLHFLTRFLRERRRAAAPATPVADSTGAAKPEGLPAPKRAAA
jgi:hypothetical protein